MAERAVHDVTCDCPTDAQGVQWHPSDCPAVAWLHDHDREHQKWADEVRRARARAIEGAATYVIG